MIRLLLLTCGTNACFHIAKTLNFPDACVGEEDSPLIQKFFRFIPLESPELFFSKTDMFAAPTIDYDMLIHYDMFDKSMDYCKNNAIAEIESIHRLAFI